MLFFSGSKDVKDLLLRALKQKAVAQQSVLDFPAGSGFTSSYLKTKEALVSSWDMFPEFFKVQGLSCIYADLQQEFPSENKQFDLAIFQEGIEHLPDQLFALKEFHRIIKEDGTLIVTTPNYSNFRSRFSYLLFESETPKLMPPNELDSIWFGLGNRIYMGHIFSIGIMRLRVLALLAGFSITKIHPARINWSSFVLGIIFFPIVLLQTYKTYWRSLKKHNITHAEEKKKVFHTLVKLNLHPSVLFGGHLIVEFKRLNSAYNPSFVNQVVNHT